MRMHHEVESSLRRGEMAQLTGCNIETLRYYEEIGILGLPDPRSARLM